MAGGEEALQERDWITKTLYADIAYYLGEYAPDNRVLDVGSGTGELVSYLNSVGFQAEGIEPSIQAVEIANNKNLPVSHATLEDFADRCSTTFDGITFLNVLEHIPDPARIILEARDLLSPEGIICILCPNDFSGLQIAAQHKMGTSAWWIALPDHINYFDFSSLEFFLGKLGFYVVDSQGDFPMELFLLMGDGYINDHAIGERCHWKRVSFELSISAELRRRIYRVLASIGVGRHVLMVAKKVANL